MEQFVVHGTDFFFTKFDISVFFENLSTNIHISLQSENNNGHST